MMCGENSIAIIDDFAESYEKRQSYDSLESESLHKCGSTQEEMV